MPAFNPDTLVSVHGYAGDVHQVRNAMPYYVHHKCPVVVLSPTDAPIIKQNIGSWAGVEYKQAGLRAYIGQASLDRQLEHLKILLTYPQNWFLMNDADSVCLSPRLPDYLYKEPGIFWANIVSDMMHQRPPEYSLPRVALQPPYFLHRSALEKIVAVAPGIPAEPQTPFIDWCLMAWALGAGVPWKNFQDHDGVSCPTASYEPGCLAMEDAIKHHRAVFLHSIKTKEVLVRMAYARLVCKKKFRL